jgi:hypothetical protein
MRQESKVFLASSRLAVGKKHSPTTLFVNRSTIERACPFNQIPHIRTCKHLNLFSPRNIIMIASIDQLPISNKYLHDEERLTLLFNRNYGENCDNRT